MTEDFTEVQFGEAAFTPMIEQVDADAVGVTAEWHTAKEVLVHKPTKMPLTLAALHPDAALFECPIDPVTAQKQHDDFTALMKSHGMHVRHLSDVLLAGTVDQDGKPIQSPALEELQKFALSQLNYSLSESYSSAENIEKQEHYKHDVIKHLHPSVLVDIILNRPTVKLHTVSANTGFSAEYDVNTLMNLYFTRDQSITTEKGVVMNNMGNTEQRVPEVDIIEFAYKKLGVEPIYRVKFPGTLEGGDYIDAGDVAFIGTGIRTNMEGITQLLENDVFGSPLVAVVKDHWKNQQQMHLDTYFNIIRKDLAVLVENRINPTDGMKVEVDLYERLPEGGYKLASENIPFLQFLQNRGFQVIPVSEEDQARYGVNFLTVKENTILAVDGVSESYKGALDLHGVNVDWINISHLSCGYGALHCMTQVFSRVA